MDKNRVVWHEGLFLRPQHLQQQERFLQHWGEQRITGLRCYGWGITHLEIDESLLALGKVAVISCRGVFPDGTPFDIPHDTPAPEPLDITQDMKNCRLSLALALVQPNANVMGDGTENNALVRHQVHELSVKDLHTQGNDSSADLQIGKLNICIMPETKKLDAYALLHFVNVIEKDKNDTVILDKDYLMSAMHCEASSLLSSFIDEVGGLLKHRGEAIANRMAAPGAGGVSEITDFLLLQLVNRYEPFYAHLKQILGVHPEELYRSLVSLAGELATFTQEDRRPKGFPLYEHQNQQASFEPVMDEIRRALSVVLEARAIAIDISERKYGVWVATFPDKTLLPSANFVLAVNAQVSSESIRKKFPTTVTMATVEKIRELVNAHLKGVEITPMPAVPRQIPYHAGFTYFEINTKHEFWKQLPTSGGLALHVGTSIPELELELWAIRH